MENRGKVIFNGYFICIMIIIILGFLSLSYAIWADRSPNFNKDFEAGYMKGYWEALVENSSDKPMVEYE